MDVRLGERILAISIDVKSLVLSQLKCLSRAISLALCVEVPGVWSLPILPLPEWGRLRLHTWYHL